MTDGDICYFCGKPATTDEHIPPQCIFFGNVNGEPNRKNLITVPSCEEHNLGKQKDDEYLRFVLIMNIASSGINGNLNIDKFIRATKRTPHVFSSFLNNPRKVFVKELSTQALEETLAYEPDIYRYHRILKQISIGLFYYTYHMVFRGQVSIAYDGTIYLDSISENMESEKIKKAFHVIEGTAEYKGENQNIFKYKVIDQSNMKYLKMVFFNTNEILIRMKL